MPDFTNPLLLSIDHATVRHLDKILFQSLSFQLKKGEQWAITGNSGAGKTAFLHTILGHFNISHGKISYPFPASFKKQHNISDPLFTHRQLMAFISQQARFKNKQNTRDFFYQQRYHAHFSEEAVTVEAFLKEEQEKIAVNKIPVKFSREWVNEHLQLYPLMQKTLIQLSNGETRRLQIAHALLQQPFILLMDNPFIGLDTATRSILEKIMKKIAASGTSIIMATTAREIPACMTHILHLKGRKIIYAGLKSGFNPASDVAASPSNWQPDSSVLSKIDTLKPSSDHSFSIALKMEDIYVKSSGKIILNKVNWEVLKGEKWALTGPNGAGKSTLLSLISGDHPQAYANKIYLFDKRRGSGESIWDIKKRIGFVSPEMHQYFRGNHRVTEVILSGFEDSLGFCNHSAGEQEKKLVCCWLQLLELSHLKDLLFKDIATGEQRLILLIRAMIKNPPLLILDEPCQGLDEEQKNHFKRVIDALWSGNEKTLLYVSHYKEDIPSCVNHTLELEKGGVRE